MRVEVAVATEVVAFLGEAAQRNCVRDYATVTFNGVPTDKELAPASISHV